MELESQHFPSGSTAEVKHLPPKHSLAVLNLSRGSITTRQDASLLLGATRSSAMLFHSCTKKKALSSPPLPFAVLKTGQLLTFYKPLELKDLIFNCNYKEQSSSRDLFLQFNTHFPCRVPTSYCSTHYRSALS